METLKQQQADKLQQQNRHSPTMQQKPRHSTSDQEILSMRNSPLSNQDQSSSSPVSLNKSLNANNLQTVDESLIACASTNSTNNPASKPNLQSLLSGAPQSIYVSHNPSNQMQAQQLNMHQMNPMLQHHLHSNYSQQQAASQQQYLVQSHMNFSNGNEHVNSGDDDDDDDEGYINHQNS